jgi:hypothetical protein
MFQSSFSTCAAEDRRTTVPPLLSSEPVAFA